MEDDANLVLGFALALAHVWLYVAAKDCARFGSLSILHEEGWHTFVLGFISCSCHGALGISSLSLVLDLRN